MTPSGEQLIMDADEDCIPEGAGLCGVCHGVAQLVKLQEQVLAPG